MASTKKSDDNDDLSSMVTTNSASHNTIRLVQIDEALQLLRTTHRIAFIDVKKP